MTVTNSPARLSRPRKPLQLKPSRPAPIAGKVILACGQAGVTAYVPTFSSSNARAEGRFGKQGFVYKAEEDVYLCPAGERLTYRFTCEEEGKTMGGYWTAACPACPLK